MSETKWTKGPWAAKLIRGSYKRPAIVKAGDKIVAACGGDQLNPDAPSIGEAAANATLIAAAPELYEAAWPIADFLDGLENAPDDATTTITIKQIRTIYAAIKKAEGRS